MASSVIQSRESSYSGSATSISLAFNSNNTAGKNLWVVGHHGDPAIGWGAPSDTRSNSYSSVINDVIDSDNNNRMGHWQVQNCAGGANTVTVPCASGSSAYWGIEIVEIDGCQNAAYDANAGQHQNNPGTGTDAVTSGTDTASAPVFVLACSTRDGGAGGGPLEGTGFTTQNTGWDFGGGYFMRTEYKSASAGSVAGTFTAQATPQNFNTVMIALLEGAPSVAPVPTQRTRRPALHAIEGVEAFPGALDSRGWW